MLHLSVRAEAQIFNIVSAEDTAPQHLRLVMRWAAQLICICISSTSARQTQSLNCLLSTPRASHSRLNPSQPLQNLLPNPAPVNNHLNHPRHQRPPNTTPRRPPHRLPLILLPQCQSLGSRERARTRCSIQRRRHARGRESRWRVDRP